MPRDFTLGYQQTNVNYESPRHSVEGQTLPDGKPLPKVTIDGQSISFRPGDTIMQAAERAGIAAKIPRYCYHPGMSIAGTCRMCTVEIEKAPKLMTSCSTPAADGMVVHSASDRVKKSRLGVMEFLLTNHPLDCPVCDKAGECELQDYNYEYGPSTSRFVEDKRVFKAATTKKLSERITLNMNRCVHCERCVRFCNEVTESHDLLMINRGWKKELTVTEPEKGLTSDYQGCLTDFCPVGALTWNEFRFQKRVWFLQKKATLCDGCSKGCNIEAHSEKDVIYRLIPRYNEKVNGHWMCDYGRESYRTASDPSRIGAPLAPYQNALHASSWEAAIKAAKVQLQAAKNVLLVIGTDATNEEAQALKEQLPPLTQAALNVRFYNGTNGVSTSAQDQKMDKLLIMKDKTPNTKGLEALGLKAMSAADLQAAEVVIAVRFGRALLPAFQPQQKVILWGVFNYQEVKSVQAGQVQCLLPGLASAEKSGSYTNTDNQLQSFIPAIQHKGHGLPVAEVLRLLAT